MNSFAKLFSVGAALCLFITSMPNIVNAEVFFVEDQKNRFTISFPDLWYKIDNQKTDDKLTVSGPGRNDFAICKVRTREERKYLIYPEKFASEIQRVAYSKEFWDSYLGDYNDVTLEAFRDNAGLARGHAGMAEVSFETVEGALVRKKGVMFAAQYHDKVYVVDCSAEESVYQKWRPTFLSIIKSVDFIKVTHERPEGNYRSFLDDDKVEIQGQKSMDTYKF